MTRHQLEVPLATLADLGITSHRGRDWARDEIVSALADSGCPAPPLRLTTERILEVAGARLARALSDALPQPLVLVDDVIWGPPATDRSQLERQAMSWRDQAAVGEIVARTGLWSPPAPDVMPNVRIEARADEITSYGHRIGTLVTRTNAQYWAVYGVRRDGALDLATDFATEAVARSHAARWRRPGVLICADRTEELPTARPTPSTGWRSPVAAGRPAQRYGFGAGLRPPNP